MYLPCDVSGRGVLVTNQISIVLVYNHGVLVYNHGSNGGSADPLLGEPSSCWCNVMLLELGSNL